MEESTGIIVDYSDWTNPPSTGGTRPDHGTFSYGYTTVIYIPAQPPRLKTTHNLPNGDVITIG